MQKDLIRLIRKTDKVISIFDDSVDCGRKDCKRCRVIREYRKLVKELESK